MKENVYINQIVRFLCLRKINIHMNKELVNLHEKKNHEYTIYKRRR